MNRCEGLPQGADKHVHAKAREKGFQVDHRAADRRASPGGDPVNGVGHEAMRKLPQVGVDQKRAVGQNLAGGHVLRGAGNLAPIDKDGIAVRKTGRQPQGLQGPNHRLQDCGRIRATGCIRLQKNAEVEIARIVVHGPAPGHPPHER